MAAASKSTGVFEFRLDSWNKYTLVNLPRYLNYRNQMSINHCVCSVCGAKFLAQIEAKVLFGEQTRRSKSFSHTKEHKSVYTVVNH